LVGFEGLLNLHPDGIPLQERIICFQDEEQKPDVFFLLIVDMAWRCTQNHSIWVFKQNFATNWQKTQDSI